MKYGPIILRIALIYPAAALGGWAASAIGVPLAWLLGPLIVTAVLAMSNVIVPASARLRRLGQTTIGATVGLGFTPEVAERVISWLPLILVSAAVSILISAVFSTILARLASLDHRTAYFGNLPGGLAEMSNVGQSIGARPEPIVLIQTIRVTLVVLLIPPFIRATGLSGNVPDMLGRDELPLDRVLIVIALCLCFAWLIGRLRVNNPWPVGAIVTSAILLSTGLVRGSIPHDAFVLSQFFLGISLGSRLQRSMVASMPRVALSSVPVVMMSAAASALYAIGIAWLMGIGVTTALLGTSAGGMSEMAATAHTLHVSAQLVLGFHVARNIMVNGFATAFLRALERVKFFDFMDRQFRR